MNEDLTKLFVIITVATLMALMFAGIVAIQIAEILVRCPQ